MEKKGLRIGLFYAVVALFWMALYAYVPILSTYSYDMGAAPVMVGSIISSYGFMQMALRIPLGILSDKLRKRKLFVIIGLGVAAMSALGLGFARTPLMLLFFRALAGAAASVWVLFTVLFSSYFDASTAPKAMATVTIFNNLGQMTGTFLGGQIAGWLGSRCAFFLACLFGLCALGLGLAIHEKTPENPTPLRVRTLLRVGRDRTLLAVSFLGILYQIINQGATMGFTPKYASLLGGTIAQQGYITSVCIAGMITTSFLSSKFLLARFGPRKCILTGQLLTAACTYCIPLFAQNISALLALQFGAGLGNGLTYPLLMGLAIQNIDTHKRGAAMGFFQSIYALGMFIGPLLTGFLSEVSTLRISLLVIGSIGFFAWICGFWALPRERKA